MNRRMATSAREYDRIRTVLGRRARDGDVQVIQSSPYRYQLET